MLKQGICKYTQLLLRPLHLLSDFLHCHSSVPASLHLPTFVLTLDFARFPSQLQPFPCFLFTVAILPQTGNCRAVNNQANSSLPCPQPQKMQEFLQRISSMLVVFTCHGTKQFSRHSPTNINEYVVTQKQRFLKHCQNL